MYGIPEDYVPDTFDPVDRTHDSWGHLITEESQ